MFGIQCKCNHFDCVECRGVEFVNIYLEALEEELEAECEAEEYGGYEDPFFSSGGIGSEGENPIW